MKINKLFVFVAACFLAIGFKASAQVPTYAPQVLLTSYVVTGGQTSNSIAGVIPCGKQQNVALQWVVNGGTNSAVSFAVSVDGITYDTNHFLISWTNAASVPFVLCTNIAVTGFGYLRLDRFTANGTINATNDLSYGVKISSP